MSRHSANYVAIQIFGSGWSPDRTQPDENGIIRCNQGIQLARDAVARGATVCIILAPGLEVWCRDGGNRETMAAVYAAYIESYLSPEIALSKIELCVNTWSQAIWGTIAEVVWGWSRVKQWRRQFNTYTNSPSVNDMSSTVVLYVSDPVHLERISDTVNVKCSTATRTWQDLDIGVGGVWFPDNPLWEVVPANHPPPSRNHERLSYAVLTAHRVGLGDTADYLVEQFHLWRWRRSVRSSV